MTLGRSWFINVKVFFRNNDFLMRSSTIIIPTIIAAALLSTCQSRTLGILFPIIIPVFLYFLPEPSCAVDSEASCGFNSNCK